MAEYYVSDQNGDDYNNGNSPATSFATITKATEEVLAGDTVYIGPGVYNEEILLTVSGTEGNEIRFIPDSMCKYLTDDKPGIVRLTAADANGYPVETSAWAVWDFGSTDYNVLGDVAGGFGQIYIDGADAGKSYSCGIYAPIATENNYCYGAVVNGGYNGIGGVNCDKCISIGVCGFHSCDVKNSIGFGWDAFWSGSAENCLAFGGEGSFALLSTTNCMAIGSRYGFNGRTHKNSIAVGCQRGFIGSGEGSSTNMILDKCWAFSCDMGFSGSSTDYPLDISNCYETSCASKRRGGSYETGDPLQGKVVVFNPFLAIEAFKPMLNLMQNFGDDTVDVGIEDIMGHARRMGDGTIDIGAYEHSDVTPEWTEYKSQLPAIRINRAGQQMFKLWAKGGVNFAQGVWVKWQNYSGTNKPQLIAKGNHMTEQISTATGDGTDWELLNATATPTADGEVRIYLYARDIDVDAVTFFSDIN